MACSVGKTSRLGGGDDDGSAVGQGGAGGLGLTGSGGLNCTEGDDADGDGFTIADGDCNDCDPNVNPSAAEVPTAPGANPADENCDGNVDEPIPTCDGGLAYDDLDPRNAARAMELCTDATPGGSDYGVLEAKWVRADGQPFDPQQAPQVGLHDNFGPNVPTRAGERMLVLSSGFARLPGQSPTPVDQWSSALNAITASTAPSGFPQNVPNCEQTTEIFDDIGLEVRLRAPSNATGYQYLFKFYSFEFAEYVCTQFNDQYIALVTPPPMGSINGNISFDSASNPVSVNIAFFDSCDPVANNDFAMWCQFLGGSCPPPPTPYCPAGPADLQGNGFADAFGAGEDGGATAWLQTTAPIGGGEEFTIRFAIWDTGDDNYDSTVLIDGFQWTAEPGTQVTTEPPK